MFSWTFEIFLVLNLALKEIVPSRKFLLLNHLKYLASAVLDLFIKAPVQRSTPAIIHLAVPMKIMDLCLGCTNSDLDIFLQMAYWTCHGNKPGERMETRARNTFCCEFLNTSSARVGPKSTWNLGHQIQFEIWSFPSCLLNLIRFTKMALGIWSLSQPENRLGAILISTWGSKVPEMWLCKNISYCLCSLSGSWRILVLFSICDMSELFPNRNAYIMYPL